MSWSYLRELEGQYWPGSCLDGAPDALLRLMPTADGYFLPDSATESSPCSLSGTTSKPSAEKGGRESTLVSGGFPCQDIAAIGRGAGIEGERSGLWSEMARVVGEVRPRFVFVENSPMLNSRGLGRVLGDLAVLGYDAEFGVLGAHNANACHKRDRLWILAHANGKRPQGHSGDDAEAQREGPGRPACQTGLLNDGEERTDGWPSREGQSWKVFRSSWWDAEPELDRVATGWPIGFSALSALEMDKYQQWLCSHSEPS